MSGVQFLSVAIVAAIVTLPAVKFIPRARQSPAFDRVLWGATWLLAFLGAWYAVDNYAGGAQLAALALEEFARAAGAAIVAGAAVGALSLNILLWLMDRFMAAGPDEAEGALEQNEVEEENVGTNSEAQ